MKIVKRQVSLGDSERILQWRNSAPARNASRTPKKITGSDHGKWFSERLSRISLEPFWIMSILEEEIGYIRLDQVEGTTDSYIVSIYLIPKFRAKGIGQQMLRIALESAILEIPVSTFIALIKKSNQSSIALFRKFGFYLVEEIDDQFYKFKVNVNEITEDENSI